MTTQNQLKTNHIVRIAILSTGERVLCLFGDVKDDSNRIIGYKMVYPFSLSFGEQLEDGTFPIKYTKWCPYTPVQEFRINGEHIVSVTFPDNNILDKYIEELKSYGVPVEKIFFEENNNEETVDGNNGESSQAGE